MSQIFFDDTYIAVIPTYENAVAHKHSMLHVFLGKEPLTLGNNARGNMIILEQNVVHQSPKGNLLFFLLVDPTSEFASKIRSEYLKGNDSFASDISVDQLDVTEQGIKKFVKGTFGEACFIRRKDIDERIASLLESIDCFEQMESKIPHIAQQMHYSESYLSHLFKKETGVSIKKYLLLRRVEYVWKKVLSGENITNAALIAGFSSSSHFSDTCKELTGISVTGVLR